MEDFFANASPRVLQDITQVIIDLGTSHLSQRERNIIESIGKMNQEMLTVPTTSLFVLDADRIQAAMHNVARTNLRTALIFSYEYGLLQPMLEKRIPLEFPLHPIKRLAIFEMLEQEWITSKALVAALDVIMDPASTPQRIQSAMTCLIEELKHLRTSIEHLHHDRVPVYSQRRDRDALGEALLDVKDEQAARSTLLCMSTATFTGAMLQAVSLLMKTFLLFLVGVYTLNDEVTGTTYASLITANVVQKATNYTITDGVPSLLVVTFVPWIQRVRVDVYCNQHYPIVYNYFGVCPLATDWDQTSPWEIPVENVSYDGRLDNVTLTIAERVTQGLDALAEVRTLLGTERGIADVITKRDLRSADPQVAITQEDINDLVRSAQKYGMGSSFSHLFWHGFTMLKLPLLQDAEGKVSMDMDGNVHIVRPSLIAESNIVIKRLFENSIVNLAGYFNQYSNHDAQPAESSLAIYLLSSARVVTIATASTAALRWLRQLVLKTSPAQMLTAQTAGGFQFMIVGSLFAFVSSWPLWLRIAVEHPALGAAVFAITRVYRLGVEGVIVLSRLTKKQLLPHIVRMIGLQKQDDIEEEG